MEQNNIIAIDEWLTDFALDYEDIGLKIISIAQADGAGPVRIHRSVKERWDADPSYRRSSRNLGDYLKLHGWPSRLDR